MAFAKRRIKFLTMVMVAVLLFSGLVLSLFAFSPHRASAAGGGFYQRTNLVSDIAGVARFTDPNLVNPWGIAYSPTSPFWIADNGTGKSTLYNGHGQAFPVGSPLVVRIPPPRGSPAGTTSAPTGTVFNGAGGFMVTEHHVTGTSFFIFATEDGTISGWNPNVNLTHAVLAVDNSKVGAGAVYKGLTLGSNASGNFLFAANFRAGAIDVFNDHFKQVSLSGSFTDTRIPTGYAPFNIQNLGGLLYVTYAKQDAAKHDDVSGPGHGFVDVFDTNGNFIKRLASRGTLNSPWGLALAPADFGPFSNDLLVGNFGDGRINAFDPNTGAFLGQLTDRRGNPIQIDDLWGLKFGNGGNAGQTNTLFFTAGIGDEQHGLFGLIQHED